MKYIIGFNQKGFMRDLSTVNEINASTIYSVKCKEAIEALGFKTAEFYGIHFVSALPIGAIFRSPSRECFLQKTSHNSCENVITGEKHKLRSKERVKGYGSELKTYFMEKYK